MKYLDFIHGQLFSQLFFVFIIYLLRTSIKNLSKVISKDFKPAVSFRWCINPEHQNTIMLAMLIDLPSKSSMNRMGESIIPEPIILDSIKITSNFSLVNHQTMFHCYDGNIMSKELPESVGFAAQSDEARYRKSFLFILKPNDEEIVSEIKELQKIQNDAKTPTARQLSQGSSQKQLKSTLSYYRTLSDAKIEFKISFNLVYRGYMLKYKRKIRLYKDGACLWLNRTLDK